MIKRSKGAVTKVAPKPRSGDRHAHEASMLLRMPRATLELLTEAAAAEGNSRMHWALQTLVATAAHDLKRDVMAELERLREES